MTILKKSNYLLAAAIFLTACSEGKDNGNGYEPEPNPVPTEKTKLEIKISPSVSSVRVSDYGFEQNDRIGLYVANYLGELPTALLTSGNHVDNMCFTYSGDWTPETPIYWKDETTHADMYLYYPYTKVSNVNAHSFTIKENQSDEVNYKASEFIYGKAENVSPTTDVTRISARHLMSRIEIKLEAGNGFTKESIDASEVSVYINGIQTSSNIDLSDGSVFPTGEKKTITPRQKDGSYVALLVPQTVDEMNLITVNVDGSDYNLKTGFTFESGKNHTFKVILRKTSAGINVDINPWINDETDHGGYAE